MEQYKLEIKENFDKALKEYFEFADNKGCGDNHDGKLFEPDELEEINKKRDELFGEGWRK